jgi:mannose-6-phosphate isomerase-like protein (cupin superfamily)
MPSMATPPNSHNPQEAATHGWVKHVREFSFHTAQGGIRYKKLTPGTALNDAVEVDFVPVLSESPISKHAHSHAETLCIILSGRGYLSLGDETFQVEVGHAVYIPSGVMHGFTAQSDDFTFLSIQHPPIGDDYIFPSEDNALKKHP